MLDNVTVALLIGVVIMLSWAHVGLVSAYLKRAHPPVWFRLGEPAPRANSLKTCLKVWKFFWLDHSKVDDLPLRAYVVSGQILHVLVAVLLLTFVIANWARVAAGDAI
jgi:hypothetical protein